ncbi:ATP-binding cassette sub-family G member 8 [Armadillidium vulgare]|nr:ATP-binding cassette sub-family G member 8 [Armadillidium vulgare]
MMMNSEYVLELISVFHTGQVEPGTCFQKLMGNVPTGVILKDVSLEVHGGELMAIMGSKGSGKRALLEVISRRAQGPTKGQILLNHVPMSLKLFQESCAYVTHRTQLIEGITTYQTLLYSAKMNLSEKMTSKYRESRVKQVLADLALIHVANRKVENLTPSEYRRVVIGVQMIKDPIVMLLDEPAWGLDPLNTYLIVSILSNHAKKYNRIMVVTMEKPRYYHESREGTYYGPVFVITYAVFSMPLSFISTMGASAIVYLSLVYYDNFYYLTYGIIFRYVSAFLHEQMFDNKFSHFGFNSTISCESNNGAYGCRYSNGSFYLLERFHISGFSPSDDMRNDDLAFYRNFGVPFAFVGLMTAFNIVLYLVPLPAFIKSKFRE